MTVGAHDREAPTRRPYRRAGWSGGFATSFVIAGVMSGLLSLAGAKLLETAPPTVPEQWQGCLAFPVQGEPGDDYHIRVENTGPEPVRLHATWLSNRDGGQPDLSQSLDVAPWGHAEVWLSPPAPEGLIHLWSSVKNLYTSTEVYHASGTAPDTRYASLCLDQFS
jgi:hypothetical protein